MTVNDRGSYDLHAREKRLPSLGDCEECFHYVSIGDFKLSMALSAHFEGQVQPSVVYSTKDHEDEFNPSDPFDAAHDNLVAYGNPRVSWVVNKLQGRINPNFFIDGSNHRCITNREPKGDELNEYTDNLAKHGKLYAAVIRQVREGRVVTLISAQNGPALEAVASVLTDDRRLKEFLASTGWGDALPADFELLFEIQLGVKEEVMHKSQPKLIAHRPHKPDNQVKRPSPRTRP
jgi:hypothetical protein